MTIDNSVFPNTERSEHECHVVLADIRTELPSIGIIAIKKFDVEKEGEVVEDVGKRDHIDNMQ
jgi:hypothetical protein